MGGLGLSLVSALFALGAAGLWFSIYPSQHHFVAPWPKLLGTLVVVVVVGALAMRLPGRSKDAGPSASARAPSAWLVGVGSFIATSLFMGVHQVYSAVANLPGVVPIAVTVAIPVATIGLPLHWSRGQDWGPLHRLALAAGALFTYGWNGFLTMPAGDRLDVAGQVVVDGLAVALVVVLAVRLSRDRSHRPLEPLTHLVDRQEGRSTR